jgi:hypothetical protein
MAEVSLDNLEAAWESAPTGAKEDNVAEKLMDESEKNRDSKMVEKNKEITEVRNKISTLTNFLDVAYIAMGATTSDTIQLTEHADLLFTLKGMLPEHAAKLIGDRTTFSRREVEMLCQMMTRRIDSEYAPQIEELKDDMMDIMQVLDKLLPILKDLLKKEDDHTKYIIRQPR